MVLKGTMGVPFLGIFLFLIQHSSIACLSASFNKAWDLDKRLNVLMIVVDDLRADATPFLNPKERPWLYSNIITPNMERLASRSMVFTHAYTQMSRCNPSRASFLTGRRPDSTRVLSNEVHFRSTTDAHLITLPEFFKNNGYITAGVGKTFHTTANLTNDDEYSWSLPSISWETPYNNKGDRSWFAIPDDKRHTLLLEDERTRGRALTNLEDFTLAYNEKNQPFFLMVGFKKPHLPFNLPESFLEEYSWADMSPAKYDKSPINFPESLWSKRSELYDFKDMADLCGGLWTMGCEMPVTLAKKLRRAYYGCVTCADSLIGDILDKMDDLQMWNDTVVVLMSDHGYHLGENGWWAKTTTWEAGLHVPLMVSIPGVTTERMESSELVELVDVYPTLLEATGFDVPDVCPLKTSGKVPLCTEGSSLLPIIRQDGEVQWKERVFSQSLYPLFHETPTYNGYSMRTKQFRYTEWVSFSDGVQDTWSEPAGVELYDLEKDPNQLENKSEDPDYQSAREELSGLLHQGWIAAQPRFK